MTGNLLIVLLGAASLVVSPALAETHPKPPSKPASAAKTASASKPAAQVAHPRPAVIQRM